MPIKTNQIAEEPLLLEGLGSAPTTGSGKGLFYAIDIGAGQTEGGFVDEAGNEIQLTNAGALNLGDNNLGDLLNVSSASPSSGQVLAWNGSQWAPSAAGSGEANTASNLPGDEGVFASKSSLDLQFKSLTAGTNISLSSDANAITINATGGSGEVNTASNTGAASDADVFKQKTGVDLEFRRLTAGTNVTITENADDIVITSTGGTDNDAIHDNVAGEIAALTEKVSPASADLLIIEDSADSNNKKKVQIGNLPGGGSSNEFSFNLAAGADIATRVAGASNVPAGWTLEAASTAGITQLGSLAETLTITHNEGKVAAELAVFEETTSGPASLQGVTKIDLSAQGDQKTTTSLNESGIIDLQTKTNSSKTLIVFVKFIG